MQINRLFEIVHILLDKKKISAGELAEHFGVSRQTICRDIDALSIAGIPVYTKRGKGGGIGLLPDFVLNKSILTEQEQTEILSALHGLSEIQSGEGKRVLGKLSAIFNKSTRSWIDVDFSDWGCDQDRFNALKHAITKGRIVTFDYYNSCGDPAFRHVEPIQLCFKSRAWYLKGFCRDKEGLRFYKLSRIRGLAVTDKEFEGRDSHTLSEHPLEDWSKQPECTLKLRIEAEMTYRVYDDFIDAQAEKQKDGSFLVTTRFTEDDWMYGFLLSYGKYMEVLEPKHVRDRLRATVTELLKKYV